MFHEHRVLHLPNHVEETELRLIDQVEEVEVVHDEVEEVEDVIEHHCNEVRRAHR